MSLFQFNRIYVREIFKDDLFYTEYLFLHPDGNSFMMYSFGSFCIVNRGSTLNLSSFDECLPLKKYNSPDSFHVLSSYWGNDHQANTQYLVLQEGILKFYDRFNTQHGHPTTFLSLITPAENEVIFNEIQEEIKGKREMEIHDWRFL